MDKFDISYLCNQLPNKLGKAKKVNLQYDKSDNIDSKCWLRFKIKIKAKATRFFISLTQIYTLPVVGGLGNVNAPLRLACAGTLLERDFAEPLDLF